MCASRLPEVVREALCACILGASEHCPCGRSIPLSSVIQRCCKAYGQATPHATIMRGVVPTLWVRVSDTTH